MFEARWSAYQVETRDGRSLSGLIAEETPDQIVLVMMGGIRETLPRSAITSMKSLDRSLMPLGLEAAITPDQMRDLLSFLTAS
jgi:putative heme-binding domain-containing protein